MPDAVILFTGTVVFAQMYGLGTRQEPGALARLVTEAGLFARSLLAVLVVFPIAAFCLVLILPMPAYVAAGLAILAAAPGAPLTSRRSEAAAADFQFVSALQVLLACTAVFYTPLVLFVFSHLDGVTLISVSAFSVAGQVGLVTLFPAILGWCSALLAPRLRERKNRIVAFAARGLYILFLLVMVLALAFLPDLRNSLAIGWGGALAILVLCCVALLIGYALGGPKAGTRSGVSIATIARNIGLALYISELHEITYPAIPTILLYALIGVGLALPFSLAMRRSAKVA